LRKWSPEESDVKILMAWLMSQPNSLQSSLARAILGSLEWSSIDWQMQLQFALITVETCLKYAPEKSGPISPGTVAEGVSSLAALVFISHF
jgi:hypothetical protein